MLSPRPRWLLGTLIAVLTLPVTGTAASAAPPPATGRPAPPAAVPASPAGPAAVPASLASPAGPAATVSTVLLLSGDRVTHTAYPDGTTTVTVAAADRPDGRPVAFETVQSPDGYYVVPTDARSLLARGTVDRQLFNVTTLVADGLAGPDQLPVITTGGAGSERVGPLAATTTATLTSIGGAARQLDRDAAGALWRQLTGAAEPEQARSATAGATRVWLDRAVEVSLAESVPQIGVPAVRDAGYDGSGVTVAVLDTGIDPEHPDVADRITGTANFTPDQSFVDGHGHGTHVASIVAGSGAASGGTYQGVAPGAELLIGKVLPDSGTGPTSAVIDGMEWAAQAGADIVNLSLSAPATDGTDPASLAADRLTAETGTLFVAASGNNDGDAAVGTPGAAASALTVGAVNKMDALASFSNRGPRRGDAAVKPELTAPGDAIVAARAAGTSLGSPVDDSYTTAGGTSMATPHVAGSAALLKQANPDWTWDQLKDALVSTAEPGDYSPFAGGAGRVDVARAVSAGGSGPAAANLGAFEAPYQEQRTEQLTYRNHTDQDVTLALALSGQAWTGDALPDGAVTLGADTLTVPAGGTASVPLTVDAGPGAVGAYTGMVTASAGQLALRTPFGYYKSTGSNRLTIRAVDFRGDPATGSTLRAVKLDGALPNDPFHAVETWDFSDEAGTVVLDVADGRYDLYANISNSWDLHTNRLTSMVETELEITGDTSVTLDGGKAILVDPHWPEPTDLKTASASYRRGLVGGEFGTGWAFQYAPTSLYLQPAEFTTGWLEVTENWQVADSLLTTAEVRVAGEPGLELTPGYHNFFAAPAIAGERDVELVWGGTGSAEELAAAGVAGKVALVGIPVPADPQPNPPTYVFNAHNDVTDAAVALGAAGVLFYVDEPGALGLPGDGARSEELLQLSIPYNQGVAARALVDGGPARLVLSGERDPDRIYRIREWHEDPALPEPRRRVDRDELVPVQSRYHSDQPDYTQRMFSGAFTPRESVIGGLTPSYWAPLEATDYYLPGEHLRWVKNVTQLGPPGNFGGETLATRERFLPGDVRRPETWFQSPMRTGAPDVPHDTQYENLPCTFCRKADRFLPGLYYLDSDARHRDRSFFLEGTTYRMFADGVEIPNSGNAFTPWFQLDGHTGRYRLEQAGVQPGVPQVRTLAPRISTAWTFWSRRPAADAQPTGYDCPFSSVEGGCAFQPLLQLDYQLGLDLLNRAPAGTSHTFTVEVAPHSRTDKHLVHPVTPPRFRVWYSTDAGETWQPARVRAAGRSEFAVTVAHPPLAGTDGYVWLRADAMDVIGNRVEQTIVRAYALR